MGCGTPNPAEVASLIQRLGSDEIAVREEAARRLEAAGDAVIVPLRRVGASSGDPDLRLRALVLARKIESAAYGEVRRLIKEGRQLNAAAISPDGRHALAGGLESPVLLLDTATGKEIRRFEGHTGGVWAVAFSSDGRRAVSGGGAHAEDGTWIWDADSSVRLWDVATGKELRPPRRAPQSGSRRHLLAG
jgi:WD40 repeat protein